MTLDEGMFVLGKVLDQLQKRLTFSQPTFIIKIMSKDGLKVSYHGPPPVKNEY